MLFLKLFSSKIDSMGLALFLDLWASFPCLTSHQEHLLRENLHGTCVKNRNLILHVPNDNLYLSQHQIIIRQLSNQNRDDGYDPCGSII